MDRYDFETACAVTQRHWGAEVVLTDKEAIDVISSGSIALDHALGIGGFPKGRITEIFGLESAGKTTMALHAIAAAQKNENTGYACFIDSDHALTLSYAKQMGVNLDKLIVLKPDNKEKALCMVDEMASKGFDIMVIDSLAALIPEQEIKKGMEESEYISEMMNGLVSTISEKKTALLIINQIRLKPAVMFGNPEFTLGGYATKYYSSIRVDLRKIGMQKEQENVLGYLIRAKVVKNKLAAPHKEAEFLLLFGEGIVKEYDLISVGLSLGLVERQGSIFLFDGEIISRTQNGAWYYLKENPKARNKLTKLIEKKLNNMKIAI